MASPDYNPTTTLAASNRNIMAPLWADVDTRNTAAGQVTYSTTTAGSVPQVNGRNAFFVNWIGVASYNNQSTPTDSFQLVIVDRSDTGAGNFDFMFNYDQVTWDIATSASTSRARAGWGRAGTGFELPGSGTAQGSASALHGHRALGDVAHPEQHELHRSAGALPLAGARGDPTEHPAEGDRGQPRARRECPQQLHGIHRCR